ncbi:dicarboxylate transporter/tellurite-resistance protein TehA [Rhizobium sp. 11515TR]|uniref:dicarboxylate transporter/tellurite-resistance protein TehA n=1 Tax=Rhizobium sp. 11515TR TaxID=2028343 RepID=UPI000BA8622D|nr:dicarboxylate transporter/tellurite-resistance protein TehA [Rhizobium sp. 11515TR]ASW08550.1 dicarboxylate transporter/tellurite-resistance protein TehA [Rhizobium sp. 11515TR]
MTIDSTGYQPKPHELQTGWLADIAGRTPAAYFGMVLGLAGLGNAWRAAEQTWHVGVGASEYILALAVAVWAILVLLFLVKASLARDKLAAEVDHPVQCCFVGLIGVATMLVAGAVEPYSYAAAVALFIVGFAFTSIFAVWRTGGLWHGERDQATTTAVLYLPTVAGSFVTATIASSLGHQDWGQLAFGAGIFSWLAIESVLLHRLLTGPMMLPALRPTLGVQLAPAPVGAVAYIAVSGGAPDVFAHALIGYGLLQLVVLLRLSRWLREAGAVMGFWAFSFGATSIATAPIRLLGHGDTAAISLIAPVAFALANVFVLGLVIMTLWLLLSGRMYGRPSPAR